MDPEEWSQIEDLFEQASTLEPAEREALLAREGISPDIRDRVSAMLRHAQETDSDANDPADGLAGAISGAMSDVLHIPLQPGANVGRFRIERLIASGGMGDVYLAQQIDGDLDLPIALKLARASKGEGVSKRIEQRFLRERSVLLDLDHPCIPRPIDAGTTEHGRPFLAMEFVEGLEIAQHCRTTNATIRQRVALVMQICDAIHHAHQRLIVHRDIKPANVLVRPDGQPRVLDFGIASPLGPKEDRSRLTHTGEFIGTLAYASPEQLDGSRPPDTRSDIYSLGVMLYELLTDTLPHADTTSLPMLIERMRDRRPTPPRTVNPRVSVDLNAVVMRAIAREPERRYQSASAFSSDLQNVVSGLPVQARADSRWYLFSSEIKRRRVPILIASLVLVVSIAFAIYATNQSQRLEDRNQELRAALAQQTIERARLLAESGSLVGAERLIWPIRQRDSDAETRNIADWALRDLYTRFPVRASTTLSFSPSPSVCALDGSDLLVIDAASNQAWRIDPIAAKAKAMPELVGAARIASSETSLAWVDAKGDIHVSPSAAPERASTLPRPPIESEPEALGFVGTMEQAWIIADGTLWIYSVALQEWRSAGSDETPRVVRAVPLAAGFLALCADATLRWFDNTGAQTSQRATPTLGRSRSLLAATHDGASIALAIDSSLYLFDPDKTAPNRLDAANGWIESIAITHPPDSPAMLIACSADNLLRIWRLDTAQLMMEANAFESRPVSVIATRESDVFATVDESRRLRVWELPRCSPLPSANEPPETVLDVEVSQDANIAALSYDGRPHRFLLTDLRGNHPAISIKRSAPVCAAGKAKEADTWFAADYAGGIARLRQSEDVLSIEWETRIESRPNTITVSPDGATLGVACDAGVVMFLNAKNGDILRRIQLDATRVPSIDWDPTADEVFVCTYPQSDLVRIRDPLGDTQIDVLFDGDQSVGARVVKLSPDARNLALGGDDARIRIWRKTNKDEWTAQQDLAAHAEGLFSIDFTASSDMLASAGRSGTVFIWDLSSGQPVVRIDASERMLFAVSFAKEDRAVLAAGIGGKLHTWNIDELDNRIAANAPRRTINAPPSEQSTR